MYKRLGSWLIADSDLEGLRRVLRYLSTSSQEMPLLLTLPVGCPVGWCGQRPVGREPGELSEQSEPCRHGEYKPAPTSAELLTVTRESPLNRGAQGQSGFFGFQLSVRPTKLKSQQMQLLIGYNRTIILKPTKFCFMYQVRLMTSKIFTILWFTSRFLWIEGKGTLERLNETLKADSCLSMVDSFTTERQSLFEKKSFKETE